MEKQKNKKRLFKILDEMNISDVENNTANVAVCPNLVGADYSAKLKGTKITMGTPGNIVFDLQTDKIIPVLLLVNRDEYERLEKNYIT